ncbi:MAG: signal peptide peptidase SppA [Planctomycetota bacterium]
MTLMDRITRRGLVLALALAPCWVHAGWDEEKDGDDSPTPTKAEEKNGKEGKEEPKKEESPIKRLIELKLDEHLVPARMINLPIPGRTKTVQDVLDRFEEWSKDEKVGAVLLDIGAVNLGSADVDELRAGVQRLRDADKKVTAFLNGGSPDAYMVACAADDIVIPPIGNIIIPGIGAVFPFMKGHFQLLGMEFDVITAGRFKYPGFLNEREPNEFFREEYNAILNSWFYDYQRIIGQDRDLSPEVVTETVNTALLTATQAQQRGLVDTIAYYDECRDRLLRKEKLRRFKTDERGLAGVNSIQDLFELMNSEMQRQEEARKAVGPKIAVLHARGPIVDMSLGAGLASQIISRDDFVKVVDELRRNKSIKAVVMRVDSPGGSAFASDVIWRELRRLNEEKPLIVSMGNVAGSGGYYIACPARKIFAQPTTITGSIGVLGIFLNAQSQYNRADYELAEMKRGQRATLGSTHRAMEKDDRKFIQEYMLSIYSVFVDRVALTRRMPAEKVREIGEGRIYTGRQAKEIGLVDELGGLSEAIESAREMANIPDSADLKIVHYPRASSLGEIFESFGAASLETQIAALLKGTMPAKTVSFQDQLMLFSTGFQPLCWVAVPPFWGGQEQGGLAGSVPGGPEAIGGNSWLQLLGVGK